MAGLGLQVYRLATAPDSDMRKIVLIVLLVYCIKTCVLINYLPKWRWLVMDIYRAAKQWGKYWQLATGTEIYQNHYNFFKCDWCIGCFIYY